MDGWIKGWKSVINFITKVISFFVHLDLFRLVQVEFEFRLSLHSHLAQIFFDEVIKKMVRAFFNRAENLYGPQSLRPERLKVITHESH